MKHAKDYLEEANRDVTRIPAADAVPKHGEAGVQFIDVRDSKAIADTGTIAGALRIPRGMMEFRADPNMEQFYNPALKKDGEIYLICGAGGQAALTGKTMQDMGYTNVTNIGGFPGWKDAGGPTEDA